MKGKLTILIYLFITACVDPIHYDIPSAKTMIVVDGGITDQPGPYVIRLSHAMDVESYYQDQVPLSGAVMYINSDVGEHSLLTEVSPGVYQSSGIQGVPGRSYSLQMAFNNKLYLSDAERLAPAGTIDKVGYEFVYNSTTENGVSVNNDHFDIYMDATGAPGTTNYLRWRLTGTYKIQTFPELRKLGVMGPNGQVTFVPNPPACATDGPLGECTCCTCWMTDYGLPLVSDDQLVTGSAFRDIKVGVVPVTRRTFFDRYYVEVEQLALTPNAFLYWKLVKAQKDGASSLFQPPLATLSSNVYNVANADEKVLGYFWAGSVIRKTLFLTKDDVPYRVAPIDTVASSCLTLTGNVTNVKPVFWP